MVAKAIRANVFQSIDDLLTNSEEVRELVKAGKVKVVGAVYDLHMGKVEVLGEHPMQSALLLKKTPVNAHDSHAELIVDDHNSTGQAAAHAPATPKQTASHKNDTTHASEHTGNAGSAITIPLKMLMLMIMPQLKSPRMLMPTLPTNSTLTQQDMNRTKNPLPSPLLPKQARQANTLPWGRSY